MRDIAGLFDFKLRQGPAILHRLTEQALIIMPSKIWKHVFTLDGAGFYRRLVSRRDRPDEIVRYGQRSQGALWDDVWPQDSHAHVAHIQVLDSVANLPDDKVDRATRAASVEVRVPLLHHWMVEFAWLLRRALLMRGGRSKWLQRLVISRHVPARLVDKPKMGFAFPTNDWLRGPLHPWAEELLGTAHMAQTGVQDLPPIRRSWQGHLSERSSLQSPLWVVLILEACRRHWMEADMPACFSR